MDRLVLPYSYCGSPSSDEVAYSDRQVNVISIVLRAAYLGRQVIVISTHWRMMIVIKRELDFGSEELATGKEVYIKASCLAHVDRF